MKLVHWRVAVGGWAVTFGTAMRGSAQAPPRCAAHSSTASVPITVLLYNVALLCGSNMPNKGLKQTWHRVRQTDRRTDGRTGVAMKVDGPDTHLAVVAIQSLLCPAPA